MATIASAPIPPEPQPWAHVEYENNISSDEETDDDQSEYSYCQTSDTDGYESEDSIICKSSIIKRSKKPAMIPVPYYKSILQEEEYFSE